MFQMNIMTKRGGLDNIATFEHVCDRKADLDNIPKNQITLGSLAIVLKGENDGLEVYMANSKKEWILLMGSSGSGGGGSGIDLSQDTVDVLHLVEGYTAHDSTGAPIVGQVPIRTIDDLIQSGDIITMPGGYYAAATEIKMPPTEYKNLNLIDYDGTLLHAYTTAEALKLEELPSVPEHSWAQGGTWNWTLNGIQKYLNRYPEDQIMIGACYTNKIIQANGVTSATEIDIEILNSQFTKPYLRFSIDGEATIDWGDGSSNVVTAGQYITNVYVPHQYDISEKRNFTISIIPSSLFTLSGSSICSLLGPQDYYSSSDFREIIYRNYIKEVRLGTCRLDSDAFSGCHNLKACSIGLNTVISADANNVFANTPKLKTIIIPLGAGNDKYENGWGPFFMYSNAEVISFDISSTSVNLSYLGGTHSSNNYQTYGRSLKFLTLSPYLQKCLVSLSIMPSLKQLTIPDFYPITLGSLTCISCNNLTKINLPKSVTFANYGQVKFLACPTLKKIIIPEGITTLPNYSFGSFTPYLMQATIVFPSTLTTLEESSFNGSFHGSDLFFQSSTPPTAQAALPSRYAGLHGIYVPYSEDHSILNAYKTATNWSTLKSIIFEYNSITFTIDGQTYTGMPFMSWYDWIFSEYNTNNNIKIYYETNEMLAPNATTPFKESIDGKLYKVFIDDDLKDGATYITE